MPDGACAQVTKVARLPLKDTNQNLKCMKGISTKLAKDVKIKITPGSRVTSLIIFQERLISRTREEVESYLFFSPIQFSLSHLRVTAKYNRVAILKGLSEIDLPG